MRTLSCEKNDINMVFRLISALFLLGTFSFAYSQSLTPEQLAQIQALNPSSAQVEVQSLASDPVEIAPRAVSISASQDAIQEDIQQLQGVESLAESVEVQATEDPLRQFGYELFAGSPTTFAPATNIPVPANYVVGPGDTVVVQLYGQQNTTYELIITREGMMLFPQIGPISVAGLSFDQLRERIQDIVANQLIGQQAAVTLGVLRSIQVFILGEAFRPGAYTVSSLSTMTNALFVSGGITNIGSLRNIRLLRQGTLVAELDLYDLLLRGDTSADVRLLPGDVLFVPPIGTTVGVAGEVRRPAIYELKNESTTADMIGIAGGYLPSAFPQASRIERISDDGERTLIDANLIDEPGQALVVQDGDLLQIYSILDRLENVVLLEGHATRPGGFEWREGLRVTDILPAVEDMQPDPDLNFALIAREKVDTRRIEILHLNLRLAFAEPESEFNISLQSRDRIIVFGAKQSRRDQLGDLMEILRSQGTFENPALIVSIRGNVEYPGQYPLISGITLDALIRFSGGLKANSELDYIVVERNKNNLGEKLVEALSLTSDTFRRAASYSLQAGDDVVIFNTTESREDILEPILTDLRRQATSDIPAQVVTITGKVRYPGSYPLVSDFSVGQLVTAAGGFLESAEVTEAEITRFEVNGDEGREIVHFPVSLQGMGEQGLGHQLRPFDQLAVRQIPNWSDTETVIIGGEVRSPGSYVIVKDEPISSLLERAGGLTEYADLEGSIFMREELRLNEQRMLDQYVEELKSGIATSQLQGRGNNSGNGGLGGQGNLTNNLEQLFALIQTTPATGRLVIDLETALSQDSSDANLLLRSGDRLLIPRLRQEISVIGEIYRPTSHLFANGLSLADYVNRSGGFTENAEENDIYIVRRNGEVLTYDDSRWFFQSDLEIKYGDNIVVPFEILQFDPFYEWRNITQIIFSMATTLLAIQGVLD